MVGGHKLCVEIKNVTPSASTITSHGSLRSPLVSMFRDVNPKLNEGEYTHFQLKFKNIDEMRAKRAAKCEMTHVMTVNDNKRTENKVLFIVKYLYNNSRCLFVCLCRLLRENG